MSIITSFILPDFCVGCGNPGVHICSSCIEKIQTYIPQRCIVCRKPSPLGFTHIQCKQYTAIDGIFSFYHYKGILQRLLKRAKYKHNTSMLLTLFSIFPLTQLFDLWEIKMRYLSLGITYIPQTKSARNERGFNQSLIFATMLSRVLKLPLIHTLKKCRETKHQSSLSHAARKKNIVGAFSAKGTISSPVFLVDDVVTTGETVYEAARVLKKNNPNITVFVISLFRAY